MGWGFGLDYFRHMPREHGEQDAENNLLRMAGESGIRNLERRLSARRSTGRTLERESGYGGIRLGLRVS